MELKNNHHHNLRPCRNIFWKSRSRQTRRVTDGRDRGLASNVDWTGSVGLIHTVQTLQTSVRRSSRCQRTRSTGYLSIRKTITVICCNLVPRPSPRNFKKKKRDIRRRASPSLSAMPEFVRLHDFGHLPPEQRILNRVMDFIWLSRVQGSARNFQNRGSDQEERRGGTRFRRTPPETS